MSSIKGAATVQMPLDVVLIAIPLLLYFAIMFVIFFALSSWARAKLLNVQRFPSRRRRTTSNWRFAVTVATFGIDSGAASRR
jgi:ACR3 family arsenite transporter